VKTGTIFALQHAQYYQEEGSMSPKVKFCRNVVAVVGVAGLLSSIFSTISNPAKWRGELGLFGTAIMCLNIVREVNRREGDWHKEVFAGKRPAQTERIPELFDDEARP